MGKNPGKPIDCHFRTSIGNSTRDSRSSGYQTLDFEDPSEEGNGEQEEEEGEEEDHQEGQEEEGLISVCHSQLTDNSNSFEGVDKKDEGRDDSEYSGGEESGETEESAVRENGKDGDRSQGTRERRKEDVDRGQRIGENRKEDVDRGQDTRENGKDGGRGQQATMSVSSARKYQRAATRPAPGTVKSLMAKFQ